MPDTGLQRPFLPSSVLSFALVCLYVNFFVSVLLGNHGPSWNLNWNFHQSLLLQILPLSQSALSFLYETLLSNNVNFLALSPSLCATLVCQLLGVPPSWCVSFFVCHLFDMASSQCVPFILCHFIVLCYCIPFVFHPLFSFAFYGIFGQFPFTCTPTHEVFLQPHPGIILNHQSNS